MLDEILFLLTYLNDFVLVIVDILIILFLKANQCVGKTVSTIKFKMEAMKIDGFVHLYCLYDDTTHCKICSIY